MTRYGTRWCTVAALALLFAFPARAQNVGINANGAAPNPTALLDIDASALPTNGKLGLLIPRMTSTERAAIATPATGLLVYDTTTNSFWYYNSTTWVPLFTGTTGWSLLGNGGTVAGTNFIGTTDDRAFEVRMFNERAGFVSSGTSTSWGHRALWVNTGINNTAVGKSALTANTTGGSNTAVGSNALLTNVNGSRNTAVGYQSLSLNLSTSDNTAVGYRALLTTLAGENTAVGAEALLLNGLGTDNTAVGNDALRTNVIGNENTGVGSIALTNSIGSGNSALGFASLSQNIAGSDNTAVGNRALFGNTTGSDNVAVGRSALRIVGAGNENTAVGRNAMYTSTADANVAVGFSALYSNTTATGNVAVGHIALYDNTTGYENTALGGSALQNNTSAYGCTGLGFSALNANTTGILNTAVGHYALANNTTGSDNTAMGIYALLGNTNGVNNSAFGFQALDNNTTGDYNTAMGYQAGFGSGTQSYNTTFGFQAGITGCSTGTLIGASIVQNANTYTNISALGYNTTVDGSNRVRVGNTAITSIGGFAGWTTLPSDARYKSNVREDVGGLDFILRLRPVTYNVDVQKIADHLGEDFTVDPLGNRVPREQPAEITAARKEKSAIRYTGFIAQEVDSAAQAVGYDFSGVDKVTDSDRMLGLRYAEFVVPLVKAVQEQQALIEEQHDVIEAQDGVIEELRARVKRIEEGSR